MNEPAGGIRPGPPLHAWIDASGGIAGDMLLGALLDAGAPLPGVREAVRAVVGDSVMLSTATVTRAGQRATKVAVDLTERDPPHRTWSTIRSMLSGAPIPGTVRDSAIRVFDALARAEARVHDVPEDDVRFHEVGALDSIADVVGVCSALDLLGVERVMVSEVALGSGQVRTAHGVLPVPVPAVLELSRGWSVTAGGQGELTTPTGMAILSALAADSGPLPSLRIAASGVGAGDRDTPGRANVTRVVIGTGSPEGAADRASEAAVVMEANVDDLDPRVWPTVLAALLAAGASDAWLTPIVMKKGRPAHTLHVLSHPDRREALRRLVFEQTSTIGIRETAVSKTPLARMWIPVRTRYGTVRIKVAHQDGLVLTATPEFDDVASAAADSAVPVRVVLAAAVHVATEADLVAGVPTPPEP